MNKSILTQKLISCVKEVLEEYDSDILVDEEFSIMGNPFFDSYDIVSILASFEAEINDLLDINIVLSNEKALSIKNSPFIDVKSLTEFAILTIEEYNKGE